MSTKHTPGPWIVQEKYPFHVMTSDGFAVADTDLSYSSLDEQSQAANARMIAAAPELLEALRSARCCVKDDSAVAKMIDAAIAKATGDAA